MDWLLPPIIATLAGTIVLAATYFYLDVHDRQKFLLRLIIIIKYDKIFAFNRHVSINTKKNHKR